MNPSSTVPVVIETGKKRVFASVLDWPGWCRSARSEEGALEELTTYLPRYAPVAKAAGLRLPTGYAFQVVEHLPGDATTDFGAPSAPAQAERADLTAADAGRLADLMVASWALLSEVGRTAPEVLRKGPRGGGRDRDAVVQHVLNAEAMYARKIGSPVRAPGATDVAAWSAFHAEIERSVRAARQGPTSTEKGWPARYAVRRIVWHVLDHVWEIEDRS